MTSTELAYEKGLPANLDAERFVLGSILLNDMVYLQVAGAVEPDDFSLEKHRRIFARMKDLYDRGSRGSSNRLTASAISSPSTMACPRSPISRATSASSRTRRRCAN
jgi:hypothetical protein